MKRANSLAEELGERAHVAICDAGSEESVAAAYAALGAKMPPINGLVASAALAPRARGVDKAAQKSAAVTAKLAGESVKTAKAASVISIRWASVRSRSRARIRCAPASNCSGGRSGRTCKSLWIKSPRR